MSTATLPSRVMTYRTPRAWKMLILIAGYLLLFLGAFEGIRRALTMLSWLLVYGLSSGGDAKAETIIEIAISAVVLAVVSVVCAVVFLGSYCAFPSTRTAAILAVSLGLYAWCLGLFLNGAALAISLPGRASGGFYDEAKDTLLIETVVSIAFAIAVGFLCIKLLYRQTTEAPGVEFTQESQPELWAFVEETAARCQVRFPSEMYWLPNANAQVMHFGGWMGGRKRTALAIGLPLLRLLSVEELRATLAHEFHHLRRGDAVVFSCIYKARQNAQDIHNALSVAQAFFGTLTTRFLSGYTEILWALSRPVVRTWEFEADLFAARTVSPASMARALVKLELTKWRFEAFRKNWIQPAMDAGFLPPVLDAFWEFYEDCSSSSRNLGRLIVAHEGHQKSETHPPIRERLMNIAQTGPFNAMSEDKPAFSFIREPLLVEAAVYKPEKGEIKQVVWNEGVLKALMERWKADVQFTARRATVTAEMSSLRNLLRSLPSTAASLGFEKKSSEAVERFLLKAFAVSLNGAGWESRLERGRLIFKKDDLHIDPTEEMLAIKIGQLSDWSERCTKLQINGLVLIPERGAPVTRLCPRCARIVSVNARRCGHCGKPFWDSSIDAVTAS